MAIWAAAIMLGVLAAGIVANTCLEAREARQRGDRHHGR